MAPRLPNRRALFLLLPLSLIVAGCSDDAVAPTGCDVEGACAIEGPDIVVTVVDVDYGPDQPFRQPVGAHVVAPGAELRLHVRVFNRGKTATPPAWLVANADSVEVPALEPGESRRIPFDVTMPDLAFSTGPLHTARVFVVWKTEGYADADPLNDVATSEPFHLLVPVLSAHVALPDTLRALVPYPLTVHVTNESPYTPYHGGLQFGFCFYDDGYSCDEAAGAVGDLPAVMAGETKAAAALLVIPHTSIFYDAPDEGGVWSCISPPLSDLGEFWQACMGGGYVLVKPNLEASCNPRVLALPDSFDPAVPNPACSHQSDHYYRTVVALDAEAGATYELAPGAPGLRFGVTIHDLDGHPVGFGTHGDALRFEAPETERLYILARHIEGEGVVLVSQVN